MMQVDQSQMGEMALAAWGGPAANVDQPSLGEIVARLYAAGQERWPDVPLDPGTFARFVGERIGGEADPGQAAAKLSGADLYLTCACLHRSEAAAMCFRDYVFGAVRRAVAHISPDGADDVMNRLYDRLFLADEGRPPRISQYQGQGDVRRWVSVVACRIAVDRRRRDQSAQRVKSSALERMVCEIQSMELTYLRGAYRDEFRDAFATAVQELDKRDRNVLRYQLEGLTADQVGRLYNVHRVTVARWLSRIRETLLERTRAALRHSLGLSAREADSILRLVEGEVSVSLNRLLASRAGP